MAEIRWTEEALQWLRDIYNYIAGENSVAAGKVIFGIYEKAQILRTFPEMGHKYRSEPEGDIRILLYGHYRIAYLLKNDHAVDVLGVFHGAMNIEKYLQ
jgi:plasmid stabilization system protein ParE